MKPNNKFCGHYRNNMHNDLFQNLKTVNIFKDFAILEFHISVDFKMVNDGMRSLVTLSDDEIKDKFDMLMKNDAHSDIEILEFNDAHELTGKIILEEPEFTESSFWHFDYMDEGPTMNVFTYMVRFKSMSTDNNIKKE